MGTIEVSAERAIAAPAEVVYGYIADMRDHHQKFLPPNFSDFRVESGGVGAGTITRFKLSVSGRTRNYHMKVDEPEPGKVLTESDMDSTAVTKFTVTPQGGTCSVQISTSWQGAGGVGGFFERTFGPPALRKLYADELGRLDAYAREQTAG
jgi:uncharacterized protein YndB with AHSA1/START domain